MYTILDPSSTNESQDIHVDSNSSSQKRTGFNAAVVASNTSELRIGEDSVSFF